MQVMNGPYNYTRGTLSGQHTQEKWYTCLLAHIFYRTSTMLDLANAKFAFLDLETTGLSPWFGDRICEVGIILTEGKRIKTTYQTLVNPERLLSPAAASTHRLTDSELARAPLFADVAAQVEAGLKDAIVVCHNAPFDLQFLDSEFRRLGREIEIPNLADTHTIARELFETPSYTLVSLAEAFHLDKVEAHRALADALTKQSITIEANANDEGHLLDVGFQRSYGAVHLGNHPPGDGAVIDKTGHPVQGDAADQFAILVLDAGEDPFDRCSAGVAALPLPRAELPLLSRLLSDRRSDSDRPLSTTRWRRFGRIDHGGERCRPSK